ncbi:MAG: hypothetical protein ACKVHE_17300 [Planctomycetales bacterium]|jgi:hypothetical protein
MARMKCFCHPELIEFATKLEQRSAEVAPLLDVLSQVTPPPGEVWLSLTTSALGTTLKALREPNLESLAASPSGMRASDDELAVIESTAQVVRVMGIEPGSAAIQRHVDAMADSVNKCTNTLRQLASVVHPLAQKLQPFGRVVQMAESTRKNLGVDLRQPGNSSGLNRSLRQFIADAAPILVSRLPVTTADALQQIGKTARLMNSASILGADLTKPQGIESLMSTVERIQQIQTPNIEFTDAEWTTLTGDIAIIGLADQSLGTSLLIPEAPVTQAAIDTLNRNLDQMHDNLSTPPANRLDELESLPVLPDEDSSELDRTRWHMAREEERLRDRGEPNQNRQAGSPQVTDADSVTGRYPIPPAAGLTAEDSSTIENCVTLGIHLAAALPALDFDR